MALRGKASPLWRHGGTGTPEYIAWLGMRERCYVKGQNSYPYYGGKGIRVCRRWRRSFRNFLADMGRKPSAQHTIERRDNRKGYAPNNCYWATRDEQARNRSQCWKIKIAGATRTVVEWARFLGVSERRIYVRLHRGWTRKEAVLLPMSQRLRRPGRDGATVRVALKLLRAGKIVELRARKTTHWRVLRAQRQKRERRLSRLRRVRRGRRARRRL